MEKCGKNSLLIFCCVLLTIITVGCAPVTINTTVLVPGEFDQPAQFKKVAVLPFNGPGGKEFAAELEGKLASIIIDDKQYFEVVDRAAMDKILGEMKLAMTGIVDPTTAAQVGKMAGAKAIYTGTITASSVSDSRYQQTKQRCVYEVTKTDRKGRKYKECGRYVDYVIPCTKRTAQFACTPKLIEVETGRIVYSNSIERTMEQSACSDDKKPLPGAQEMRRMVQEAVKDAFRKDVAPYTTTMKIVLMDSTSDIDNKNAVDKLKSGLDFAKHNRLDRACELWKEAKAYAQKSTTLLYNLGVCAEVAGQLDEAQSLYKQTDYLMNKPDKKVTKALARVSDAIKKRAKLRQQGAK